MIAVIGMRKAHGQKGVDRGYPLCRIEPERLASARCVIFGGLGVSISTDEKTQCLFLSLSKSEHG
jgi:hypothetical protein